MSVPFGELPDATRYMGGVTLFNLTVRKEEKEVEFQTRTVGINTFPKTIEFGKGMA